MEFYPYHDRFSCPENYTLTDEQRAVVFASAYGDGYLSYPHRDARYPRIKWNIGCNFLHADYKRKYFSFLGAKLKKSSNPGFGTEWNSVLTSCHPCLIDVHNNVYPHGEKSVTKKNIDLFGDIGWAWFYGDDGHMGSGMCHFHTEGYLEYGTNIFAESFNSYMNSSCARIYSYIGGNPKKKRFAIRIGREKSYEFIQRIKKHMAPGLEYKTACGC